MKLPAVQGEIFKSLLNRIYYKKSGKAIVILSFAFLLSPLLIFFALLIFANPILNGIVKQKIINSVESNPGMKMRIGYISFHPFKNGINIENLEFIKTNPKDSSVEIHIKNSNAEINSINWLEILLRRGYKTGEVQLQKFYLQINRTTPDKNIPHDSIDNKSPDDKRNIKELLLTLIPDKLLPLQINEFTLNTGNVVVNEKKLNKNLLMDSIKNISFKIEKLNISPEAGNTLSITEKFKISSEVLYHRFIDTNYKLKLDSFIVSTEDSIISTGQLEFKPYMNDSLFFAAKKYKSNRYNTRINKLKITGIDFSKLFKENSMLINKVRVDSFLVDIIENKRLPDDPNSPAPKMPNELLQSVKNKIKINSLYLNHGLIRFSELFPYSDEPAVLSFTNTNAVVEHITNYTNTNENVSARINISSNLAGMGRLSLLMNYNLVSHALSLNYKGRLDSMDMTRINDFLKIDAGVIVKSCKVKYVTFNVDVKNGQATGVVEPVYDNLKIEKLDKEQGKTNIWTKIISFFAKNAKLHESNPQDGDLKKGKVDRKRSKDEVFIHFIWVSVRDALGEAVGF